MVSFREKVSFTTPDFTSGQISFAENNKTAVHQWIKSLPKANIGEMARRLYGAIQEINNAPLPPLDRLAYLELVRPAIHYTCRALNKHYLKNTANLSLKERKVANLTQALQTHLLTGYKTTVSQMLDERVNDTSATTQKKSPLGLFKGFMRSPSKDDNNTPDIFAKAIHRAINESGLTLLHCYQLYTNPPRNIWRELHSLYLIIEEYNFAQVTIEDLEINNQQHSTLSDSYKKILLLSRARPNMLRQPELTNLFNNLESWSSAVDLENEISDDTHFAINIESDQAPVYSTDISVDDPDTVRGMNTHNLTEFLTESSEVSSEVSQTLRDHLISSWGEKTERRGPRHETSAPVHLTTGLSSCHFYLSGLLPFNNMMVSHIGKEALIHHKTEFFSTKNGDPWDHVTGAVPGGHNVTELASGMVMFQGGEVEHQNASKYPTFNAFLVDESKNGFCIRLSGDIPPHIQAGALIATLPANVRPTKNTASQWILSSVRWVKLEAPGQALIGTQKLADKVYPTAVSILHKKRGPSDFMRGFYLPASTENNPSASLLTPGVPFTEGCKVRFINNRHLTQATLTNCLGATGSFSQFEFQAVESELASNKKYSHTDEAKTPSEDDFHSLWHDL